MSQIDFDRLADALVTAVEVRVERDMLRTENADLRARLNRLAGAINDPKNQWWHTGGEPCVPRRVLRDANRGPREGVDSRPTTADLADAGGRASRAAQERINNGRGDA